MGAMVMRLLWLTQRRSRTSMDVLNDCWPWATVSLQPVACETFVELVPCLNRQKEEPPRASIGFPSQIPGFQKQKTGG